MTSAVETTGVSAPGVPGPAVARLGDLPQVNLLPPEIAEKAALQRLQVGLVLGVVGVVLATGGLYFHATSGVSSARSGLATATEAQAAVQRKVNAESYVTADINAVAAAKTEVYQALGGEILWSYKLNDLGLSIPANVWLTGMSVSQTTSTTSTILPGGISTITFQGVAEDTPGDSSTARDNVAQWLDSLATEKGYSNPYVTVSEETLIGTREVVDFTSTVDVTTAALSGRYKPSGS